MSRRGGDHEEEHAAHEAVTRAFRCGRIPWTNRWTPFLSEDKSRASCTDARMNGVRVRGGSDFE
jgi:hypothetical protein